MKETLTVKENREICFSDGKHVSNCTLGVTGEKNATILKFVKPLKINDEPVENFKMRAVFNNEAGSFPVEVDSDELALGPEITAFQKSILCVQFLKNDEIKWSSFPAKVYFIKGADDSGENVIEKAKTEQREADRTELGETLSDLTGQDLKKSDWDELIDIANELPLKTEQNVLDLTNYSALTYAFEHATTPPSLITGDYKLDKEEPDDPNSPYILIKLPFLETPNAVYSKSTRVSQSVEECGFSVKGSAKTIAGKERSMFNSLGGTVAANLKKLTLADSECVIDPRGMFNDSGSIEEITLIERGNNAEEYNTGYWYEFFRNCSNLKSILGTPLDMSRGTEYKRTFQYCSKLKHVRFKPFTISHDLDLSDCPGLIKGKYGANTDDPGTLLSIINGVRDYTGAEDPITIKFSTFVKSYLSSWRCTIDEQTGLYVYSDKNSDFTMWSVLTNLKGVVIS